MATKPVIGVLLGDAPGVGRSLWQNVQLQISMRSTADR